MARTLIISDLHLGAYAGHCVLERPAVLARLVAQLSGFDRLIILGDLIELGEGRPPEEVLEIAAPVLSAIGAATGSRVRTGAGARGFAGHGADAEGFASYGTDAQGFAGHGAGGGAPEIIVMPGNHDRRLVTPWIQACGDEMPLEGEVPPDVTPVLAEVVRLLAGGGARVSVRYPGLALSDRVFLHHGHYLDRLLRPEGPYGFLPRPAFPRAVEYERGRVPQQKPTTVKWVQNRLLRPGFAQLTTAGLNWQMRRHSLPALARVCAALEISAEWVVFGHVHRLGPLPGDRLRQWTHVLAPGAPPTRFVNTGSWVEEELLIGDRRPPHPYWPGGAVIVEADGIPHPVELVDVES